MNELAANSLGMLFIGFTLATWLFGVNTLQTYVYFQKRNDDRFLLKAVVTIVFLCDMFNTIFTCWAIFLEFVQTPILPLQGNVQLESTASDIAILLVQCFFAQCIYRVSLHNKWLAGSIVCLAALAFSSGMALTAGSIVSMYTAGKPLTLMNEVCFGFALGLVTLTDIVITACLVWYLFDGKSSLGPTSKLLDGLILYCVQRGILTTVSHLLVIVLWYALQNWLWTLFQFSLGKVYTLTFLTLLNRRESLRRGDEWVPDLQLTTGGSSSSSRTRRGDERKSIA